MLGKRVNHQSVDQKHIYIYIYISYSVYILYINTVRQNPDFGGSFFARLFQTENPCRPQPIPKVTLSFDRSSGEGILNFGDSNVGTVVELLTTVKHGKKHHVIVMYNMVQRYNIVRFGTPNFMGYDL